MVTQEEADRHEHAGTIPVMLDPEGKPVQRNFVHVDDLVSAILLAINHPKSRQELFNVCMDEPVHYGEVARILERDRG